MLVYLHDVVGVPRVLLHVVEKANLVLRLVGKYFLIFHYLQGNVLLGLCVIRLHHNPKAPFPQERLHEVSAVNLLSVHDKVVPVFVIVTLVVNRAGLVFPAVRKVLVVYNLVGI